MYCVLVQVVQLTPLACAESFLAVYSELDGRTHGFTWIRTTGKFDSSGESSFELRRGKISVDSAYYTNIYISVRA